VEYRSPDSTEHKIIPAAEACCCGYSGPCTETCECCDEYDWTDFPSNASLAPWECVWQYWPHFQRQSETDCVWTASVSGSGTTGNWSASDGTSGNLPDGCLAEGESAAASASIFCHTNGEGQAQWWLQYSHTIAFFDEWETPYLWEGDWCGSLGNGLCPETGAFTLTGYLLGTGCWDGEPSGAADIDGTLAGIDCENPLP
jgi:hypothetical protein